MGGPLEGVRVLDFPIAGRPHSLFAPRGPCHGAVSAAAPESLPASGESCS